MRIVIATVSKPRLFSGRKLSPAVEARIEAALNDPPWQQADTLRRETWSSASRTVRIDVVSNEPDTTGPLIRRFQQGRTTRVASWTGYIDDSTFSGEDSEPGVVADLAGCFALVTADDAGVQGFTAVHRIDPLYVAEGKDVFVLSTSARLAHRVAGIKDDSPPLDALIGLSGPGFMLNDLTPFPGVRAVPAESQVVISTSGIRILPLPPVDFDPQTPLEAAAGVVAEALIVAAANIGSTKAEKLVHFTGGKDSRLAIAALSAAGVSFTATTTGLSTHPDVIIGRRLASLLGVSHDVVPPAGVVAEGDRIEVDPVMRAYHALRGCEGMISSYESINVNGSYNDNLIVLGGHGGELLRGGFAYGFPPAPIKTVQRRFDQRVGRHRHLLSKNAQMRLDQITEPWRQEITADPHRGSERFYRVIRTGRWHAVARSVYTIRGPRHSILADNRVVRIVAAMNQRMTAEERLTHAIIHRIRPDFCSVPFFGKRWNFEKDGPSTECDPAGWSNREPLLGGQRAVWNWRISYPPELHRHFSEVILNAPLYDSLFDRREVERFLTETASERTSAQAQLVWAMYTTSHLVAGVGGQPTPPAGHVFAIPVPKQA